MLAVFDQTVAKCPHAMKNKKNDSVSLSALKDESVVRNFSAVHPDPIRVGFGSCGLLAYSSHKQNPLLPRLFAVVDDIFCMFQGTIENVAHLKQQYGLTKTANEVSIIIEAYRTLRDRGPYPVSHVVRDINGKFAFILYDSSAKFAFAAVDADGSVPLFWGMDSDGNVVLCDDQECVKNACGRSYAPFPRGCFFTSSGGLSSFEHPQKEMKPMPWVDSSGQARGATFVIDEESKKESGMPRVGSGTNWSSQF